MAKKNAPTPKSESAPEMQGAWAAMDRGDVRGARAEAKAILAGNAPEAAKAEARELLARTGLEPTLKLTLAGMIITVVVIVVVLALTQ